MAIDCDHAVACIPRVIAGRIVVVTAAAATTAAIATTTTTTTTTTTASTPADAQGDKGKTADGFPTEHVYAILNFDANGPGGGQITIRNPWGLSDYTTGGVITISFEQFLKNFEAIQVQR